MSGRMPDVGTAIHYSAVAPGTPVYDSDHQVVGEVRQVVDNYREHILDGFVITDGGGAVRFVDAPEVTRTFERGVFLTITAAEVADLGPPTDGAGTFGANRKAGRFGRLFGGSWKRR